MALKIAKSIQKKLRDKHEVCDSEIPECFLNRTKGDLIDNREEHRTTPPTKWFLSETDKGRLLKICYIQDGSDIIVKSVFPPNKEEIRIYNKFAKDI